METVDLNQRASLEREIVGALKSAIHAHGPIDERTVSSAAKRVISAIKVHNRRVRADAAAGSAPDDRSG